MSKQKSRASRVSLGGRQKSNVAHEQKRQERFKKKREEGRSYEYKKNPYKEGTAEYEHERLVREEKNRSSRLPYARLDSLFAKLDNWLAKQNELAKKNEKKIRK